MKTDNELIAEFMGAVKSGRYMGLDQWRGGTGEIRKFLDNATELKFDTSWDWLIPVVERIECLDYRVNINGTSVEIWAGINHATTIAYRNHRRIGKIKSVYAGVVDFIKWYNKGKR